MIYAMLAEGFEEIEALTFIDILRRAEIEIKTISIHEEKCVTGAHGITVLADFLFNEINPDDADGIYLPGGMPGTLNLLENKNLCDMIVDFDRKEKYLMAICAAPMILGKLGLLDGKTATCYPSFEKHLLGANCSKDEVCISDNIFTSRGAGTAHELAFSFVELKRGIDFATELRAAMQYK